jgi:hypothetical protein
MSENEIEALIQDLVLGYGHDKNWLICGAENKKIAEDIVRKHFKESKHTGINTEFNIRDTVFLKHDFEQRPRMVTAIVIQEKDILYELISGQDVSNHYGWELQTEKSIY